MNKTIQDLKREKKAMKKIRTKTILEMGNRKKKRNCGHKHHQQSTGDGREKLTYRTYNRRIDISVKEHV